VIGARLILQLYGATYAAEGAWLLVLLVAAAFPGTLIAVAVGLMRAQNHNRQLVFSQGALCALALGLSVVLLPRAGINGVGVARLIAQASVAAYLLGAEFWPLFHHPAPRVAPPWVAPVLIEQAIPPDPLVSVVINNYNYARFLPAAIDSALGQLWPRV